MTIKVTLTVVPSAERGGKLTALDAFRHAVDFFDLLTDENDKHVVWRLEEASANSPFVCRAEPIDVRTQAGASTAVRERVEIVERNLRRIAEGEGFDDTFPQDKAGVARKMLRRNTNGIGESVFAFSDSADEIRICHITAERYFNRVEKPEEAEGGFRLSATTRQELGSVEGQIERIGTYRGKPALLVRDRNTLQEVWCTIKEDVVQEIGDEMRAREVWQPRRVRINGTLDYDKGKLSRVLDGTVKYVEVRPFNLDLLEDKDFTEGYSPREYLDRLHEDRFDD